MPRKNKSTAPAAPRPLTGPQRLNKVLAAAGLGSRRDCEQLILDGRIEVDGQPVTDLATKVDPEAVKITFDGTTLKSFRPVYFALHKPSGVLSTNSDPSGRMRAIDLVNVKERIFSVGRLDRFSEGLMLLTNDGELAQRLAHPRFGVQKLYLATVQGEVSQVDLEKLVRGVRLSEGFAKVDAVKLRRQRSGAAELEIALSEGKNREIRRILARLGHKVVGLRRLAIGPLRLGQLPVGGWRPLTREEVLALYSTTTHRRKRRGPMRVTKSTARPPEDADEPMAIGTSVGHFHQSFDDDDDGDDYGPPPIFGDEADDSDDEMIALSDHSVVGTVIPYEEEPVDDDSAGERRPRKPRGDRPARAARPQSARSRGDQHTGTRTGAAGASDRSGETTTAATSPWDLRNRQPKSAASRTGAGRPTGRSSPPRGAAARSDGPRSAAPRSAASRTTSPRPAASRSGTPRPGAGRTEGPRPAKPRAAGPRSAGPRSGGSRSAGPRTPAPRSAADRTGAPRSASSRSAAAPRSGAARTGGSRSTGPRSTGGGGAGARTSAPRSPGTGSAGPRASGSRSTGPRTGGARSSAARSGGQRTGGMASGGRSAAPKGKRGGSASRGKRK